MTTCPVTDCDADNLAEEDLQDHLFTQHDEEELAALVVRILAAQTDMEQAVRTKVAEEILTNQDGSPWRGQQNPRQGGIDNWIDSRDAVKAANIARGPGAPAG